MPPDSAILPPSSFPTQGGVANLLRPQHTTQVLLCLVILIPISAKIGRWFYRQHSQELSSSNSSIPQPESPATASEVASSPPCSKSGFPVEDAIFLSIFCPQPISTLPLPKTNQ